MKCKHCGLKVIRLVDGNKLAYIHEESQTQKCGTIMAEPEIKDVGTFTCEDWNNCIYGAGCTLSTFPSSNKKKDPEITFENGRFYCNSWKKG